jgi:hypothetical protein
LRKTGYKYCISSTPRRLNGGETLWDIPRFDAEYPLAVLRRHIVREC